MSATLSEVVNALHAIAPLELAEKWDNVGLLIEPTTPRPVRRVLLTIDLTDAVLAEAIAGRADLVVAYHPPLFDPMKRLTPHDPKQRIAVRAIEAGLAVYSPHTALDAAPGGVNDFLASGLGEAALVRSITPPHTEAGPSECKLVVFVPPEHADTLRDELARVPTVGWIGRYTHCSFNLEGVGTFWGQPGTHPERGEAGRLERVSEIRLEMICSEYAVERAAEVIRRVHPYEEPAWEVYPLRPRPIPGTGQGRLVMLKSPVTLRTLVERVKMHLKLKQVRVAAPPGLKTIRDIAVCAGAGGSVFKAVPSNAYLTGEMRHHDVLEKLAAGSAVILTDHTNTERPFLPTLRQKLRSALRRGVEIQISRADREPLTIV